MDMFYGEVRLRNNFDLTELLQPRTEKNEATNLNYSRSKDSTIEGRINQYLAASDASRKDVYYQLCDYIANTSGSLITIGFEKQQIITRRGVCKGINPNFGNPLFGFADWEILLDEDGAAPPPKTLKPAATAEPEGTEGSDESEESAETEDTGETADGPIESAEPADDTTRENDTTKEENESGKGESNDD